MMRRVLPWLSSSSLLLAQHTQAVRVQTAGSFVQVGNTLVSAMMMFLGNEEKVYILDKTQGNVAQIDGHPAWGSVWDINSHQATTMSVLTNTFCATGMHLPNGSYASFGGNGPVSIGETPIDANIGNRSNEVYQAMEIPPPRPTTMSTVVYHVPDSHAVLKLGLDPPSA
ncbi:hypothetical protein PAXINDRAFT_180451 [Paxillus involutus ATCC 200175]|uniref:Uncharacterized protein n=1 Tax=Paxillus involutus ATCC 200175 TaxID=664439 RepID=A0A0C9U9Y9_PAXIN|nr:hypothetical protein PAXINDRAFT_180451 [Paxillus involutus ATCC 200175]